MSEEIRRRSVRLNVDQARKEAEVFVRDSGRLAVWSREFFHDIVRRIRVV